MEVKQDDIISWDSKYRLKFINSISGYKGVHLIGTKGEAGNSNLAIFNSIVHISSEPPQIGFIMRPLTVERQTYNNIIESKQFTINHIHKSFYKKAHYTSAKFKAEESEFKLCNLKEEYLFDFKAPYVGESKVKVGLKLVEDIDIKSNGGRLIIGEIVNIHLEDEIIEEDGQLNLEKVNDVCVTGLNQYSSVKKLKQLPYARVNELPNFVKKERPDNVVFDNETQSYNAKILPYGTNIGAPSISSTNLSTWKNKSVNKFNHILRDKIEQVKKNYQELVEEYKINETLYNAKYEFEPIIGEVYHLYTRDNVDESFLSLIPPENWNRTHLGSFKLSSDKVWTKIKN